MKALMANMYTRRGTKRVNTSNLQQGHVYETQICASWWNPISLIKKVTVS